MKRILLTLICCCFAICGFAQEHLSFKGVPITGSITSFCQKLSDKGLTKLGTEGNITLFRGDFTGRDANIGVIAADNGKDVFSVAVMFDETDTWNTLVNTYDHYKDLYVEKYGKPKHCVENNPSRSTSNTSLMLALDNSDFAYGCIFETTGGSIEISIRKGQLTCQGFVLIRYEDNINTQAKRQSDLDDI